MVDLSAQLSWQACVPYVHVPHQTLTVTPQDGTAALSPTGGREHEDRKVK